MAKKQGGITVVEGDEHKVKRTRKTVPIRIEKCVGGPVGNTWIATDDNEFATESDAKAHLATFAESGNGYRFVRTYWQGTAKVESKLTF